MKYTSHSKENQDLFILAVTNSKRNGTYFEVGSNHPIAGNNTYLLEKEFGWTGVSMDIVENFVKRFNIVRKNPCLCVDATQTDLTSVMLEYGLGPHINYLQLDIDPHFNTFKALHNIDFDRVSFSVITYEHDAYDGGTEERTLSREFLKSKGYTLVISDVCHRLNGKDLDFEDWYVNEQYMTSTNWKKFHGEKTIMNTQEMSDNTRSLLEEMI
jgi:hypothetical protein